MDWYTMSHFQFQTLALGDVLISLKIALCRSKAVSVPKCPFASWAQNFNIIFNITIPGLLCVTTTCLTSQWKPAQIALLPICALVNQSTIFNSKVICSWSMSTSWKLNISIVIKVLPITYLSEMADGLKHTHKISRILEYCLLAATLFLGCSVRNDLKN